jgi:hypothetical protein
MPSADINAKRRKIAHDGPSQPPPKKKSRVEQPEEEEEGDDDQSSASQEASEDGTGEESATLDVASTEEAPQERKTFKDLVSPFPVHIHFF